MAAPDVSVILNVHREASYIRRTLVSLNEAVARAAQAAIRCELIVVFDRSDALTREVTIGCDKAPFTAVKYVEVDHGSLGLSRNAGLDQAGGHCVWLADADDLVSDNCIVAMHAIVQAEPQAVVFPESLVLFGSAAGVIRYYDDTVVSAADFVGWNPYGSRIFMRRAALEGLRFADLRVSRGFAYEDWHLNCELLARGLRFRVAAGTLLFYRQRADSLVRQAHAASVRQIPHTSLFEPASFARRVAEQEAGASAWRERRDAARRVDPVRLVLDDPAGRSYLVAANRIDPAVDVTAIEAGVRTTNVFPDRHWGHDYAQACAVVGHGPYTDIVLVADLNARDAVRYLLDVLQALAARTPDFRCLVLAGEAAREHAWLGRLPQGAVFLDVFNAFPWATEEDRDRLMLRLALAVGTGSTRLHLEPSRFGARWLGQYANALEGMFRIACYRFGEERIRYGDGFVERGWWFDLLASEAHRLAWVIADHERIIATDRARLGVHGGTWHGLAPRLVAGPAVEREQPAYRLLWLSAPGAQARPGLLAQVEQAVRQRLPRVQFDAPAGNGDAPAGAGAQGSAGATPRHDACLYSASAAGLPWAMLEVMGQGLPVVAPDIGGIREAVEAAQTGWLLPDLADDVALAAAYAEAIRALYEDWERSRAMGRRARAFVVRHCSAEAHGARVAAIFQEGMQSDA